MVTTHLSNKSWERGRSDSVILLRLEIRKTVLPNPRRFICIVTDQAITTFAVQPFWRLANTTQNAR